MTSKEVILAVKQGKYSPYVPLDKVFVKTVVTCNWTLLKTLQCSESILVQSYTGNNTYDLQKHYL